jgi:hypothetical protein
MLLKEKANETYRLGYVIRQTVVLEESFYLTAAALETDADAAAEAAAAATDPYAYTGARRVIAGPISVRRYWLVTVAIIVRLGDNAARNTGR